MRNVDFSLRRIGKFIIRMFADFITDFRIHKYIIASESFPYYVVSLFYYFIKRHSKNLINNNSNNNKLADALRGAPCGLKLLVIRGRSETWDRTQAIRSIKDYTLTRLLYTAREWRDWSQTDARIKIAKGTQNVHVVYS